MMTDQRLYTIRTVKTDEDLKGVLSLQLMNLKKEQPNDGGGITQEKDGFVTLQHDLELLQYMVNHVPQVIAIDKETNQVVGYALSKTVEMRSRIPLLHALVTKLEKLGSDDDILFSSGGYYVMGQICVAKDLRGSGIFRDMYEHHKQLFSKQYPNGVVTAISSSNPRSIRAHEKVGFRILATFENTFDTWHAVKWDWK